MFNYHPNCIFCHCKLPENPSGVGEHVIPKSIFGFWRIYDVCKDCMLYFGDKVDCLATQHHWLIGAMKELELPRTEKLLENLPYIAEDTSSPRKLSVIKKGELFKLKVNLLQDDNFECSEEDWEKIGIERIRLNAPFGLSSDEIETEIERIREEYKKLAPGASVFSELLKRQVRKAQFTNVTIDTKNLPPITPLIAKIAVSFLSYVLSDEQIQGLSKFKALRHHARFGEKLSPYFISWCPLFVNETYHKYHLMRAEVLQKALIVDISLFGYPSWRIILSSDSPMVIYGEGSKHCSGISFILNFDDMKNRTKIFGFRQIDTKDYRYYQYDI